MWSCDHRYHQCDQLCCCCCRCLIKSSSRQRSCDRHHYDQSFVVVVVVVVAWPNAPSGSWWVLRKTGKRLRCGWNQHVQVFSLNLGFFKYFIYFLFVSKNPSWNNLHCKCLILPPHEDTRAIRKWSDDFKTSLKGSRTSQRWWNDSMFYVDYRPRKNCYMWIVDLSFFVIIKLPLFQHLPTC